MPVKQENEMDDNASNKSLPEKVETENVEEPEDLDEDEGEDVAEEDPISEAENNQSDENDKNDSLENIKQPVSDDEIDLEQPQDENDDPIIIKKKKKPIKKKSGLKMTQFEDVKGFLSKFFFGVLIKKAHFRG